MYKAHEFSSVGGGGSLGFALPFVWLFSIVDKFVVTYDEWIDENNNKLSETQAYARTISGPNEKYVVHHIVAQRASMAGPARNVLESVDINPTTNGLNLAVIPENKHLSLHTNDYYNYINKRFYGLDGNSTAIVWTLAELQVEIQLYCQTGLKAW